MATTTNLLMTKLEVGQKEKELVINSALETLDGLLYKLPTQTSTTATPINPAIPASVFPVDTTVVMNGVIVVRESTGAANTRTFTVNFAAAKGSTDNTIQIIGTPTINQQFTAGTISASVTAVTANTSTGGVYFTLTPGASGVTLYWTGTWLVSKITG